MSTIHDLIRTNQELTSISRSVFKDLAANAVVKESAFAAGAMAAALAEVRPTFGALALARESTLASSLGAISRLIHKEMEIHSSLRKGLFASLDLVKPLNLPSLALADSFKVPPPTLFASTAFLAMKDAAVAPQFSAITKLLGEVNVVPGRLYGLTALSESVLSSIRVDSLGVKLGLSNAIRESVLTGLGSFSDRYREFLAEAAKPDAAVLPTAYVHLPAVEHLNQAELSAVTSEVEPTEGLEEARGEIDSELLAETEDDLTRLVSEFDPDLLIPIRGAREALVKRGTDYERHTATSLREAFTHALHQLAPDDMVKAWSTSKADFDEKKRPTRAARLRYICREVSHTFGGFLTTDVDLAVQFINEFHRATHGIAIRITHDQLVTMRTRMEGLLRLMLLAGLGRLR